MPSSVHEIGTGLAVNGSEVGASSHGPLRTQSCACCVCGGTGAAPLARVPDFEYGTCERELPYVRCVTCGHVYLAERPVAAELPRIYPPGYGNYDEGRQRALTFRVKSWLDARGVRRLAKELTSKAPSVLDVGCADGRLLQVCREALPVGAALEGVEISAQAARGALAKGFAVRVGSIDELELDPGRYDLVFLQQVIEHVYAPDAACTKLAASLAPGGLLVVETPCVEALDFKLFQRRHWGGYHAPRHFNLFTARSLGSLARAAGLEVMQVTYTPQPIHWVWSLHHVLVDRNAPAWLYRGLNLQNPFALAAGTLLELTAGLFTRRMSNLRMILRKPLNAAG